MLTKKPVINKEKLKFVQNTFPNVTSSFVGPGKEFIFYDKDVLNKFSGYEISSTYLPEYNADVLSVMIHKTIEYKDELLWVYYPKPISLSEASGNKIYFPNDIYKICDSAENKILADFLLKDAHLKIIDFIKSAEGFHIDRENLNPRLGKLLIFS